MLTPRRIEIFKAIVDEFIRTAEPVGSKALMEKYNLPYSSATIRNDMQELEEMGYLEKTHTSSGRIPSTLGYKFYCENLLDDKKIDEGMQLALQTVFENHNLNLEDAIQQSCNILSQMTNLTSGALGPDSFGQKLEHIKVFPLDERSAVCVFVTNSGHTESKSFHFDQDVSSKDIETCCDILNERLKGTPITDLCEKMENIQPILASQVKRHEMLFAAFVQAFMKFASENVYFSGKTNMLYQPEFADIEKLKQLMGMLEDNTLWRSITSNEQSVALKTNKGSELTWLDDVAVVKSKFKVNEEEEGELMVVGPSRMDYDKIVSLLEYASAMIEQVYGKGGNHGK